MRTLPALLLLLPLIAAADESATNPDQELSDHPVEAQSRDIVVTASRRARDSLATPASVSRIDGVELGELSSKHQADALNRAAGVYIQRGSGAESLGAIRSPVLAGAGACGAFLVVEDNLPIRPVGFCNLNEMFELNYEQAGTIEVLRGPGSATYGASAVHGVINVLTPRVADLPAFNAGVEGGSDSFKRVRLGGAHSFDSWDLGAYGTATRAPGWRAASGVDDAKVNLLADTTIADGTLRLRAAGTVLNQETAGFIQGFDAYRDDAIARSNPNPEAFRDASSARVSAHYQKEMCPSRVCAFEVGGIYRRSRMDFLQHFLIGKPLEHNAQTSYLVTGTFAANFFSDTLEARVTVDAESAFSELTEFQPGPATDGTPAANAIRPAGYHYDYTVSSDTLGTTVALEYALARKWSLAAALRADRTRYDYDNHMIVGNTRADGTACGVAGCLYSRPADRTDTFDNVSPRITLSWRPREEQLAYLSGSSGFRPPETTELYRLQRQQSIADLDSEEMAALELGWKLRTSALSLKAALYAMNKRDLILRESNGFNVSNGRSTHRGFEYEARWSASDWLTLRAAGTYARHRYAFSRAVEGGETITAGNDIDTAPRHLHNLGFDLWFTSGLSGGMDLGYVGSYFLDAANTASYPGHKVANLRVQWNSHPGIKAALRVDNVFDTGYADRADFAFGNYRYFPARGRAVFLSIDYSNN
jgi:iron complex outermembrane recepter protein